MKELKEKYQQKISKEYQQKIKTNAPFLKKMPHFQKMPYFQGQSQKARRASS